MNVYISGPLQNNSLQSTISYSTPRIVNAINSAATGNELHKKW